MRRSTLLFLFVAFIFSECATVAVTGRRQLSLVSNEEIIPLANEQYSQVIAQGPLSNDAEQVALIKKVGTRIQQAVEKYMSDNGLSDQLALFNWEYNLIAEDVANAWCMPGGKVAFYTGIMPICKNETGVAVVMGHEVAHAIASHGNERMSQAMLAQAGLSFGAAAMGENPTLTKQLILQAAGIGTKVGLLKFSRNQESEAL